MVPSALNLSNERVNVAFPQLHLGIGNPEDLILANSPPNSFNMEAEEREKLIERSNALRQELKTWEREFAAANNGQKAAREDIKQNPEIGIASPCIVHMSFSDILHSPEIQRLQQHSRYSFWQTTSFFQV
jgi:hypothetical protein